MQVTVNHPVYGEIQYVENTFSGKKYIFINSVELAKKDKVTFLYRDSYGEKEVRIIGNLFKGVKLDIDGTEVEITPPTKWHEYVAAGSIFVFVMTWGNNETLSSIFPIIGGGLGGAISGFMMYMTLIFMKSAKKRYLKPLIWLGMFAATLLICFLLGVLLLLLIA